MRNYIDIVALLEAPSKKNIISELSRLKKSLRGDASIIWHQTGIDSAVAILADGFKTGQELGRGEHTGAIFFTGAMHKTVQYNRDGDTKTVYLPASISGLKLAAVGDIIFPLNASNQKMVDAGAWTPEYAQRYQHKTNMENGDIPKGYDGLYIRGVEYALTKEAADRALRVIIPKGTL